MKSASAACVVGCQRRYGRCPARLQASAAKYRGTAAAANDGDIRGPTVLREELHGHRHVDQFVNAVDRDEARLDCSTPRQTSMEPARLPV